jgi:hypothetical protein
VFRVYASLTTFALSLAWPCMASAQGLVLRLPGLGATSFSFTNTSIVRYRGENYDRNDHDDHFGSLTERLDIAAQAAPWRLYLRLDGFSPFFHDTSCTGTESSLCYLRGNWRPERLNLRYQREGLTLEVGDFYQVFGRGLVLSFRKVDPIGLDTTLRGGRFEYERDRLTVRAFAGLGNPQNLDPISLSILCDPNELDDVGTSMFCDPRDVLAGASFATRLGTDGDIEVSGHVVHAAFERSTETSRQDTVDVAGWRVDFPSLLDGDLTLYGEANFLRRVARLGVDDQGAQRGDTRVSWGRGIYGAAQLIAGQWTLLAEWKDYTNYLVAPGQLGGASPRDVARIYSTAPSLERDDQRIFTNSNARGARLRIDYALRDTAWIFTLNSVLYGWSDHFDDQGRLVDPWDNVDGYLTSHTYLAVRRRSRPVTTPNTPGGNAGASTPAAASTGGAAIPSGGGLGGGGAIRVGVGDYNLIASLGYRREFHAHDARVSTPGEAPEFRNGDLKHESLQADFDIAFPVGANDSLEIRIDNRIERNFVFNPLRGFVLSELGASAGGDVTGMRGGVMVSWSHGLPLVVSAMLRWDNTNRASGLAAFGDLPFGRAPDPSMRSVDPLLPTLYPSAEVRWNFTISNFVRIFGGMTPGGLVCSGGVCRNVPLFQGATAELVLRI